MKTSGSSLKRFFLYHIEKLILVLAVVLLGLFFWLGYNTETYDDNSPEDVVQKARQTGDYIVSPTSWDNLAPMRAGDSDVVDRINRNRNGIDTSSYAIGPTSVPVLRESPRKDPPMSKPIKLVARSVTTQVLLEPRGKAVQDVLLDYPIALSEDADSQNGMGGMMMEDMMMDEDDGNGRGRGGRNRDRDRERERQRNRQKRVKADAGTFVDNSARYRMQGVRPDIAGLSPEAVQSFMIDIVSVTGLVEHKNMWNLFQKTFADSAAFYPERDRPVYEYVQIERRELDAAGKPVGDVNEGWTDVSQFITEKQRQLFPRGLETAPEVAPAGSYDPYLTMVIPPITGFDYKQFAVHPDLELREFLSPEIYEKGLASADNLFKETEEQTKRREMLARQRQLRGNTSSGRRKSGAFNAPSNGMGGAMEMDGGMEMDMDMGNQQMNSYRSRANGSLGRAASDPTDIEEVLANTTEEPKSEFKMVRFFDMSVKAGKTYEYRVRLWIRDPNNVDPELERNGNFNGNTMDPSMEMMAMEAMPGEEVKKKYEYKPITYKMRDPATRQRLNQARDEGQIGSKTYFVSEKYDGSDEWTEVKVPQGHEYLRFARPTQFSDPVSVSVERRDSFFFAGQVEQPRTVALAKGSIADGDPSVEMVVGSIMKNFAKLPVKVMASAGALLDVQLNENKKANVLHPVRWTIHEVDDQKIETGAVLVDIMGGKPLDLPRSEPVPYSEPGEALVMDDAGNFHVQDDIADRGSFRRSLLLADERSEYGGRKAAKREKDEREREMEMGGFGGR